jgi:hypothetical protein
MPAAVQTEVVTAQIEGELELVPRCRRNQGRNFGGLGTQSSGAQLAQSWPTRDTVVVAMHAREEQLLVAHAAQERF